MSRPFQQRKKCKGYQRDCSNSAVARGWCPACYDRAKKAKAFQPELTGGVNGPKYVNPDKVLEVIAAEGRPCGKNKLVLRLFNYHGNGVHKGLEVTLRSLVESGKILGIPFYKGTGYIINKKEPEMPQYTISAKVPKKDGSTRNSIETDIRQRAIYLGNVFTNNGWQEVTIELNGKSYLHPWGDLP